MKETRPTTESTPDDTERAVRRFVILAIFKNIERVFPQETPSPTTHDNHLHLAAIDQRARALNRWLGMKGQR